jgi:hypothetical protein
MKLKPETVPTWDGNENTLARWVEKVGQLADTSPDIFRELGKIVPRRFTNSAETWYYSIPPRSRKPMEQDWGTLKAAIADYWMNHSWLEDQKFRANSARYREVGHSRETPSEYVIRKMDLIRLVYDYTDSEIIRLIVKEAPDSWSSLLQPQFCKTVVQFQNAIKYHESTLLAMTPPSTNSATQFPNRGFQGQRFQPRKAHVNMIGWTPSLEPPKFPKDDKNISPRKTPESVNARPCRHCGSGKHWDYECKHSRRGERQARANFVSMSDPEIEALNDYDELYYGMESEDESPSEQQDFCSPFQSSDRALQIKSEDESSLEGEQTETIKSTSGPSVSLHSTAQPSAFQLGRDLTNVKKFPLNRATRRNLAKSISKVYHTVSNTSNLEAPLIELHKYMARPPGCSFLGATAAHVPVSINSPTENHSDIIIDSGSDITLISAKTLESLSGSPKMKKGQKINLVQVTGKASISGYVELELYFNTKDGPVKIKVEAYVVKGMTTPLILGNDFADQYSLSVKRMEGRTFLEFGDSGRTLDIINSVSPEFISEDGHAFRVRRIHSTAKGFSKRIDHRRSQRIRRKTKFRATDQNVRSKSKIVIPPETCVTVPVIANFPEKSDSLFVEKVFSSNRNLEDVYAAPDSLIDKENPILQVSNFSSTAVTVQVGQVLGKARNPENWLDRPSKYSEDALQRAGAHANLIRKLAAIRTPNPKIGVSVPTSTATSQAPSALKPLPSYHSEEDPLAEEPLEGGPKIYEVGEETVNSNRLIEELDINPELPPIKKQRLERILKNNQIAFGLDDRLGHLDAKVQIPLNPGAKPISLPPFPSSPAKREVIDKQMDKWIQLGVIEPSKSPWAAPAFIIYRNGKPRMVVDYRRLNEIAIADEFPLPKQEDILQALVGCQWLSTLDALAGFTQLEIDPKEREKLAFRTHRGLWQFVRMPFGYKNGPSIFQRVMQNVLAPFLWIFALVYIDDIVIFSKSFDDHLNHLDQVFKAVAETGITLATTKCHFAYQSLLLLGQKVSRLGLSTHMEKVSAILNLDIPKNTHDLQIFLGMMVYFSSYIPFYAWIAAPLFSLLRKDTRWEWTDLHTEAFELCKQVLTNAPVRGYAVPGSPYRLYSDACDFGLAAILQQVQKIQLKDLKGTKIYEKCEKAFSAGEPVPSLVIQISKTDNDVPPSEPWGTSLEETWVYIERVIAYWSRILKPAEKNYSPTEREALALKEGLIKFQPYIEGETILAVTDHAALQWSKTFQNVNRRLLTWGTVFSAYPHLRIVHRAGRVHSNVDPISRLRRRIPFQSGPSVDATKHIILDPGEDPLKNMYTALGSQFEEKLLKVASNFVTQQLRESTDNSKIVSDTLEIILPDDSTISPEYYTTEAYSTHISITAEELNKWKEASGKDPLLSEILRTDEERVDDKYSQYQVKEDGLVYFEDWNGNLRLVVPESLRVEIMNEVHNTITEAAHGGYAKTYNRIAAVYYWPRMSRDIKKYTSTCDICQKAKPRRHAPIGMLQPIPIPSQPFEVVTMDFIPELPECEGYDNVLVIVDKLTKYAIFIPTTTTITEKGTAELFFQHVISQYGIPRQVITDRDIRWKGEFWREICDRMGMTRALTTAYHPQADGQTEIMNQSLEISLRAYIGPKRDNWVGSLNGLALSYNSTPHTATGFSPAYLLRGYVPITGSSLLHSPDSIPRNYSLEPHGEEITPEIADNTTLRPEALEMIELFKAERQQAQEALQLGQYFQKRAYNRGRLAFEFEEGEKVLINPHSLSLLRTEKGRGRKLLMKYDGPFEIIKKISPVSYRLRMPASYGIHPVLNIAHLEKYQTSPPEFGERPQKSLNREDFDDLPEYEVERIVAERRKKGRNGKRILQYLTRFKGYSEEFNEWLSENQLKNAPEPLELWKKEKEQLRTKQKESSGKSTAFLATTVPRVIKRSHVPFEPPSFQSGLKNGIKGCGICL